MQILFRFLSIYTLFQRDRSNHLNHRVSADRFFRIWLRKYCWILLNWGVQKRAKFCAAVCVPFNDCMSRSSLMLILVLHWFSLSVSLSTHMYISISCVFVCLIAFYHIMIYEVASFNSSLTIFQKKIILLVCGLVRYCHQIFWYIILTTEPGE